MGSPHNYQPLQPGLVCVASGNRLSFPGNSFPTWFEEQDLENVGFFLKGGKLMFYFELEKQ